MSKVTPVLSTNNQYIVNYDTTKIFLRDNKWERGEFTNDDAYDSVTLPAGTLLGRIAATGKLVPHVSTASDGSQFPVGILGTNTVVGDGETKELTFCTAGEVIKSKVILGGSDTFATVISGRTLADRIAADTVGIVLIETEQLTDFDNQ